MLHQIVYCGNVPHLNEILTFQISNTDFRFLCKSLDDKTVREVAAERAHIHPQMMHRVERIVAIDQLLNNVRDEKWELVRQFIRQQPDIVNEKPPYRKLYLAHYLSSTGRLDMFKDLSNICEFKLDLLANNKTISEIAREHDHIEFAEHVESLHSNVTEASGNDNAEATAATTAAATTDSNLPYPTSQPFFSQGFYDDPGIMIFSLNTNSFGSMFLPQDETSSYPNHNHHHHHHHQQQQHQSHYPSHDLSFFTHSMIQGQNPTTMTMITTNSYPNHSHAENEHENLKKSKSNVSQMTEEEQVEYESTIMENLKKFSSDSLENAITCCITKAILKDPGKVINHL